MRDGGGVGSAGKAGAVVLRPDADQFGDADLSMAGGAETRSRKGSVMGGPQRDLASLLRWTVSQGARST